MLQRSMASSQKKVIVRRFSGESLAGYLPALSFVDGESVTLLDLTGRLAPLPLTEIKFIAYVRDFNLNETASIERVLRRTFLARPRTEGLWVRVTFRSSDTIEGLVAPGLDLLDEISTLRGLQLALPDARTNASRLYLPRVAMSQLDLLGIIAARTRRRKAVADEIGQNELFETS